MVTRQSLRTSRNLQAQWSSAISSHFPWETGKQQEERISQIWATLKTLFPRIQLGPSDINDPTNLPTLSAYVHLAFGDFSLAFEPTGELNEYYILMLNKKHSILKPFIPPLDQNGRYVVTFENHDTFPLPFPDLLETHSALARILHASGMARYLDEVVRDGQEIGYLAPDGTTILEDLLAFRSLLSA